MKKYNAFKKAQDGLIFFKKSIIQKTKRNSFEKAIFITSVSKQIEQINSKLC